MQAQWPGACWQWEEHGQVARHEGLPRVHLDTFSGVASPSEEDHPENGGLEKERGETTKSRTQSGEDAGIGSEQG